MTSESIKSDRIRSSRDAIRIRDDGHCILVCDIHERLSEKDFFTAAAAAAVIVVVDDDGINDNQFESKN